LKNIETKLLDLFRFWSNSEASSIQELPLSGSNRKYFRIKSLSQSAIGVYNQDAKENRAFVEFTKHFIQANLPVTEIYVENLEEGIYLQKDLGDETLYSFLSTHRTKDAINNEAINYYKKVIKALPKFQIIGNEGFNYEFCYPRTHFDKQSMMWDLNYFKYYFLKLAQVAFDEQSLEEDFHTLCNFLLEANSNYFLYRDFQSRNIMLVDNEPIFIDYQGGRKGALQYDLASLLYDAKADLPQAIRNQLFELYVDEVEKYTSVNRSDFEAHYYGFVLIRIMQALGAYGFRGYYENKVHFLQSIPYALANLEWILKNKPLPIKISSLLEVLVELTKTERLRSFSNSPQLLSVSVNSFSFKKGIPKDDSGNGGGFVFDCRALPNPGREDEYKEKTGMDKEVIAYLESQPEVELFFNHTIGLVDIAVGNYINRGFTSLQLNFGCTGGQHRSVYFAQKMAHYIKKNYSVNVLLRHREQEHL
jgi:aminoglycoside/choline kinase family phosphotransferase